ncbi:MAG: hypothetical protein AAF744_10920 [Pseudomonadota bacterium]
MKRSGILTGLVVSGALALPGQAAPPVRQPAPAAVPLVQPALTQRQADEVVALIRSTEAECARQPEAYRVDCLRYGLWDTSRRLATQNEWRGDNIPLIRELQSLNQDLKRLVDANADPTAPRIPVRRKQLQAVRQEALPRVNAAARARIAETETRLLRSAGSAARASQFTKVAQALGSTKRILRS